MSGSDFQSNQAATPSPYPNISQRLYYNFYMQSGHPPAPTPDVFYTLWCVVDGYDIPFFVELPDRSNVDYLKQKIQEREPALYDGGVFGLILWQLKVPVPIEPIDTLLERLPSSSTLATSCVNLKTPSHKIRTLFLNRPPDDCIHILIVRRPGLPRAGQEPVSHSVSTSIARSLPFDSILGENPHVNSQWATREGLVSALYTALKQEYLVQVRGTPGSGKTVLMHLLHQRIRQDYPQGFIRQYNSWPPIDGGEPGDRLRILDPSYPRNEPGQIAFLLLDDAQDTYGDDRLWAGFLKSVYGKMSNYRVALFCSYGSSNSTEQVKGTPPILREAARFSLWPKPDFPWGLLLRPDEFSEVVQKYDPMFRKLDESLLECIYKWTAGHAGATCEILDLILHNKSESLKNHNEKFTDEDFRRDFSLYHVLDKISSFGDVARGLPRDTDYEPQAIGLFRELLTTGSVESNPRNPNANIVQKCHRRGWLYEEHADGHTCYLFASPLHASCIAFRITPVTEIPEFSSVFDLSMAVIRKFKRSQLHLPIRRAEPVHPDQPPEAQWQDEFYRATFIVTNGTVRISPEFASSRGAKVLGRTDFFIPSVKWGIEITRDGKCLRQHNERFQDGGAYHAWLKSGDMASYILLDFRQSIPKKPHPNIQHLYHVVFNAEYQIVTIYDRHVQIVGQPFSLLEN